MSGNSSPRYGKGTTTCGSALHATILTSEYHPIGHVHTVDRILPRPRCRRPRGILSGITASQAGHTPALNAMCRSVFPRSLCRPLFLQEKGLGSAFRVHSQLGTHRPLPSPLRYIRTYCWLPGWKSLAPNDEPLEQASYSITAVPRDCCLGMTSVSC